MQGFLDEIISRINLPLELLNGGFRVINFSNRAVYVEGFSSIMELSRELVTVKLKRGILRIAGTNLVIKNLEDKTLVVSGKILSQIIE